MLQDSDRILSCGDLYSFFFRSHPQQFPKHQTFFSRYIHQRKTIFLRGRLCEGSGQEHCGGRPQARARSSKDARVWSTVRGTRGGSADAATGPEDSRENPSASGPRRPSGRSGAAAGHASSPALSALPARRRRPAAAAGKGRDRFRWGGRDVKTASPETQLPRR